MPGSAHRSSPNPDGSATRGSSAGSPDQAALARLVGVRSFVLPSRVDATGATPGSDAAGGPPAAPAIDPQDRATGRPAPASVGAGEIWGTKEPGVAAAPAAVPTEAAGGTKGLSGDASAGGRPTTPGAKTPTTATRNEARSLSPFGAGPDRSHSAAAPSEPANPDRQADDRNGPAAGDPAGNPGPRAALAPDASGFPAALQTSGAGPAASAADAPSAQGATPAVAAQAKPPVREIDLDLSPSGLEDVTMTMRLAGDRLSVVIRAASPGAAGAIEGAREAIAERLAAIGQPLGSLVIQQTGSTHGTGNAAEAGGEDRRPEAQGQDRGDPRGGARRGSDRF